MNHLRTIPVISSPLLATVEGVVHGFFTREGGVSRGGFSSLNCGIGSGDDLDLVGENRSRVARRLGASRGDVTTLKQVHGRQVIRVGGEALDGGAEGDALVCTEPGVYVGVLTADCAPVLIADGRAGVVGAAHAGWKGAVCGVIEALVASMEHAGAKREDMRAAVGPAIQQDAYQVGADVAHAVEENAPFDTRFLFREDEARFRFDLPGFVRGLCIHAGVSLVEDIALDTYTDETRFFSYRRAQHAGRQEYGRQISVIGLT